MDVDLKNLDEFSLKNVITSYSIHYTKLYDREEDSGVIPLLGHGSELDDVEGAVETPEALLAEQHLAPQ